MNRNKRAATVREQIFSYNTRMILALIGICGGIGILVLKIYWERQERILDNVITNSMKYADVSPLRMHVGLEQDGGLVRVTLQDNGGGVTADQLPHLFEEFYRADESRNRKDGSGLGLYIVKYLMDAMQGSVSADMDPRCDGFGGLAIVLTFRTT